MKIKSLSIYFILAACTALLLNVSCKRGKYTDGTYEGSSRSVYTNEPFVGKVKIVIKRGNIANIEFKIVDTTKNEIFDEKYEKHFIGNNYYIEQCRNDWKGVQTYPEKLLKAQDISGVDAVSGATWSYNIFKESVNKALSR